MTVVVDEEVVATASAGQGVDTKKQKRRRKREGAKEKERTRIPEQCHDAIRLFLRNLKQFNEKAPEKDRYPLLKFSPLHNQTTAKKKKKGVGKTSPPLPNMVVYRRQIDRWINDMIEHVQTRHAMTDIGWFRFIPCGMYNPAVKITLMGSVPEGQTVSLRVRPEEGYSTMYGIESCEHHDGDCASEEGDKNEQEILLKPHVPYCDIFLSVNYLVMLRTVDGIESVLFDLHPRTERSRIHCYEDCKLVFSNQTSYNVELNQFHAENWLSISLVYR